MVVVMLWSHNKINLKSRHSKEEYFMLNRYSSWGLWKASNIKVCNRNLDIYPTFVSILEDRVFPNESNNYN